MTRRPVTPPTLDDRGQETHPAFGYVRVARVSTGSGGAVLFDSDIHHQHYVTLTVGRASRKRELLRDWIFRGSGRPLVEVAMSESQWASLVASFNTEGVSCTITATADDWNVPGLEFDSRLAMSAEETRTAADRAFANIKEARDTYEAKKTAANLRALHFAIENAGSNVQFAAESLTEHTENVVAKARHDIAAMVDARARVLGLEAADLGPLALPTAEEE